MRLSTLTLCALGLSANLAACRSLQEPVARTPPVISVPTVVVTPAPPPVVPPPSLGALSGCPRADHSPWLRFHSRVALDSVDAGVCVYDKPDLMLSIIPPLGQRYAELLIPAKEGALKAQFKIAAIVNQCNNTPGTPEKLNSVIATAVKTRRYLGGTRVEDPTMFAQQMRREYAECEGVDPAQRGRGREWAKGAAMAGLLDAQESLMFMARPGSVFYSWSRDSKENNARDAAHYQDLMSALVAARDAGSVEAMLRLGSRYAQGHRDNPPWERAYFDPMKSYAHFSAYDQIQKATGGERRERLKGTVVGDMYGRLRPEQRVAAEALAKSFLENPKCCILTR